MGTRRGEGGATNLNFFSSSSSTATSVLPKKKKRERERERERRGKRHILRSSRESWGGDGGDGGPPDLIGAWKTGKGERGGGGGGGRTRVCVCFSGSEGGGRGPGGNHQRVIGCQDSVFPKNNIRRFFSRILNS